MFSWPWSSMLAPKRKRDEEDSESEQHGDGAGPGVGADADAPSWPELVSRVLRRAAENTKEPAASKDAVAAIKALDPRMKFLERLSTEEGMLPIRAENGNGSGNAIVDVYSLLSRTFVLPSVRSATGAPMEQSKQSSSSALETRGENKAATFGAGGNMYNEQEECEKRESFAKELPKAIKDEIAHIKDWDAFDVFNLDKVSEHHSLYYVTYAIFTELDLFRRFQIPFDTFGRFMDSVEHEYKWSSNTYHNDIHAADVTHSSFLFMMGGLVRVLTPLEQLSLVLAAVIHDLGHPGVNNDFLIKIGSEVAFTHNDQSVNENNHLTRAFRILRHEDKNVLCNLPHERVIEVRSLMIGMVLATDMARHHDVIHKFETCMAQSGSVFAEWSAQDRQVALQLTLHCADIGNQTKPLPQSKEWTKRVMEEFFNQGDLEKKLEMPVSATCDRSSVVVANAQVFFIDLVVRPALKIFFRLENTCEEKCMKNLDVCQDSWYSVAKATRDNGTAAATTGNGKSKQSAKKQSSGSSMSNDDEEDISADCNGGGDKAKQRTYMSPTSAALLERATGATSKLSRPADGKKGKRDKPPKKQRKRAEAG